MSGSMAIQPQQLMNMETALYGGAGMGYYNAPSMYNNYMAPSAYNTGYYYPNQSIYNMNDYSGTANQTAASAGTQTTGQVNQSDIDILTEYCKQQQEKAEDSSIGGAITGGVAFAAISNPRVIAHPINTVWASKNLWSNSLFKECTKEGTKLFELWTKPETNEIIRDAYFQLHKAESRSLWKAGLFRKRYTAEEFSHLKNIMEEALKTGDTQKIAEATERLKNAYVNNGHLPTFWGKVKEFFGGKPAKVPDVIESAQHTKKVTEAATQTMNAVKDASSATLGQALKKSLTLKTCGAWMAIDFGMDLLLTKNIQTAFSKDTATGLKQVGQTAAKGAGNAIGWVGGQAIGTWATTKLMAKLGSKIAPGIGTVIGAVAGFVGGSIGTWLMGKVTKKVVGEDVAEQVRREQMQQGPEGHIQLLQLSAMHAQNDKNLDPRVTQAIQNIYTTYSNAA